MKQLCKRSLAMLLVLVMLVGLLPSITFQTEAAGQYIRNWGIREEVATELSDMAIAWYQAQNTSYKELSQLSGNSNKESVPSSALYKKLQSIMKAAHSYQNGYSANNTLLAYTDCQNGGKAFSQNGISYSGNNKISSFYSGKEIGPAWDSATTWNKEHTWPNSKGLEGKDEDDVMMIRPTWVKENSSRGNTAYGESGGYYHPNSASGGVYDLRGDCARIVLYVYVRWGNTSYMWGKSGVMESKEVLLKWMEEDPVDTWELGRNDVVEDITGTRNVFVDYPELGFLLFGADVPDNYTSPSGQGNSVSYNITATSNNTTYGTVSLSGKTITATPKSGYYASGYTVTSGSATVTQDGNIFTVNPQSDCTVRINFAARQKVTVSFAGADVASKTGYSGEAMTLPAVTAPEGYTFLGWMTSKLSTDTTTKPTNYYTDFFTPTASTTLYALYTYSVGGSGATEYVLTDLADIGANETTIITVTTSSGTVYAMNNDNGTSSPPAGVTVTVSADGTVLTTEPANNLKWNVGGSANAYIFYPEGSTSTWLYCTGTNNGVRVGTTSANTFKIDSSSGYLYHNGTGRYLGVYTTNPDWRCYTTNGGNIANQTWKFFVLREQGTTYYTGNPIKCEHTNTTNKPAQSATCTASGYTAGVYCNDCDAYISGHEEIAALGHKYGNWATTTKPTCTATGVQTKTCSVCGDKQTQSVAATGHSWGAWETTKQPTCTAAGVQTKTCSVCKTTETKSVAATGHNYVLSGKTYTCSACGDSYNTWFISFSVPAGVTAVREIEYTEGGVTLPTAGVPTGEYTYTFAGWATSPIENTEQAPEIYLAGQKFTATKDTTLYAVYSYVKPNADGGNGDYVKVTEAPADWSGEYLIVYEKANYIFDGSLSKLDAVKNYKEVTITNGTIAAAEGDPYKFTIAAVNGGYSIQAANGKYIYRDGTSNGLNEGTTAYAHTISVESGNAKIKSTSGVYLKFNDAQDQLRFRYYASGQKEIQLYVKNGSKGTTCYTTLTACEHNDEVPVEIAPTLTQQGYTELYCPDCGEKLGVEDYVDGVNVKWSPTLQADLTVNFQIRIHEALQDNVQELTLTFDGKTQSYPIAGGSCTVSVKVAAAQMADVITLEFTDGVETLTKTYTVQDYAKYILEKDYDAQTKAMVTAMLNYGGAAQAYFGHNTENLVSTSFGESEVPNSTTAMNVNVTAEGIRFYGASLVYREKIAVRFYFTGNAAGMTFTANGKTYIAQEKNGLWCVEVNDILPQDLGQQIKLTADGVSVAYGPMNYIVRMNQKGDKDLQNLMKALYNYYLTAAEYAAK